uniref:ATP synthase F0 subunit 8 n=1 Tax=Acrobeloides nanus TaxID=290746 RepID=A0A914CM02_9BILA
MGIPLWAWWVFAASILLIVIFLLLDWLVIRRNALGNTCFGFRKNAQSNDNQSQMPHKKSTNMVISV